MLNHCGCTYRYRHFTDTLTNISARLAAIACGWHLPSIGLSPTTLIQVSLAYPPGRPDLSLAGCQLVRAPPSPGLPVLLLLSSSMRAKRQYPGESRQCSCRSLPVPTSSLPLILGGSTLAIIGFGAYSAFTHVPARIVAKSLNRDLFTPECLSPCRYLHKPPWPLPTRATVVVWVRTH